MSQETKALVISGGGVATIAKNPDFIKLIDSAILQSSGIVSVEDPSEKAEAITAISKLDGFSKSVSKLRKSETDKYVAFQKDAIAIEKEINAPIEAEAERLRKIVREFDAEEERKAEASRQEAARIQREHEAAEKAKADAAAKLVRDAELAKEREAAAQRAAEAAKLAAEAAKGRKAKEAAEAALRLANEQAEAAKKLADAAQDTSDEAQIAQSFPVEAPVAEIYQPEKTEGSSSRKVKKIKAITNIAALYAKFPQFVELTPKLALLKAFINQPGFDPASLPGVSVEDDIDLRVTAARLVSLQLQS